jgi:hypothetical protein
VHAPLKPEPAHAPQKPEIAHAPLKPEIVHAAGTAPVSTTAKPAAAKAPNPIAVGTCLCDLLTMTHARTHARTAAAAAAAPAAGARATSPRTSGGQPGATATPAGRGGVCVDRR